VNTELSTCVQNIPFENYSGVGGFDEDLDNSALRYSLVTQLDPLVTPPDWIYIIGRSINIRRPLTSDMVTDKINILLRADYYGAADGQTSL
jgi:hypothetical protein